MPRLNLTFSYLSGGEVSQLTDLHLWVKHQDRLYTTYANQAVITSTRPEY